MNLHLREDQFQMTGVIQFTRRQLAVRRKIKWAPTRLFRMEALLHLRQEDL